MRILSHPICHSVSQCLTSTFDLKYLTNVRCKNCYDNKIKTVPRVFECSFFWQEQKTIPVTECWVLIDKQESHRYAACRMKFLHSQKLYQRLCRIRYEEAGGNLQFGQWLLNITEIIGKNKLGRRMKCEMFQKFELWVKTKTVNRPSI